jgi:prepilin-type N-terminal cleavage/methylation domain-containing protein
MKQKGFSLLELIIYVAVLSVLTMIVAGIFISINRGGGQAEARSEVNSNIRFAVEKISGDLRSATSTSVISYPASTSTPLNILTFTIGGDTISYATTTDGRLQRSMNSNPETITSDAVNIDFLKFTKVQNENAVLGKIFLSIVVEIGMSYKSDSPDWQYSENKKTAVSLR